MDGPPPAELVGLSGRKGEIAPGRDADLVVFDPEASVHRGPGGPCTTAIGPRRTKGAS